MTAFGMAQDKDNRLAASHPMVSIVLSGGKPTVVSLMADIRFLLAQPGQDGHTRGRESSIARRFIPRCKLTGLVSQIAGVLTFLVSRAGAHVSGNLISLDGGALLSGRGYARL